MQHPHTAAWESKLNDLLRGIDRRLESEYGDRYGLHPARDGVGASANPALDGLFRLSAKFTMGYGSSHGAGYIIDLDVMTLDSVSPEDRRGFEDSAAEWLRAKLQDAFPERELHVDRDGPKYKLYGDLDLGEI